jgi:hypothetical protein
MFLNGLPARTWRKSCQEAAGFRAAGNITLQGVTYNIYLALTSHFTTSQAEVWVSQMHSPDGLTMDPGKETTIT